MAKKMLLINESELIETVEEEFGVPVSTDTKEENIPGDEDNVCDYVVLHPTELQLDNVLEMITKKTGVIKEDILTDIDSETGSTVINIDYIDLKKILEKRYNTSLLGDYDVCECGLFPDSTVVAFTII